MERSGSKLIARAGAVLATGLGVALLAYVVAHAGLHDLTATLRRVTWTGFLALCLYRALEFALMGAAWFVLAPGGPGWRLSVLTFGRVARDSAADILPFSPVGGALIGARAVVLRGVDPLRAGASTVVDMTAELVAQLAFALVGIGLLAARTGMQGAARPLTTGALVGVGLGATGVAGFILAQRRAVSLIAPIAARRLPRTFARAQAAEGEIGRIHARSGRLVIAFILHFAAWVATAGSAWIAVRLTGGRAPLSGLLAIESLMCTARSLAFFVPAGIGVQEGAYALLGPIFGLSPELALSISLIKRARDVAIGAPVLLAWQASEGRRWLGGGRAR